MLHSKDIAAEDVTTSTLQQAFEELGTMLWGLDKLNIADEILSKTVMHRKVARAIQLLMNNKLDKNIILYENC